MAASILAKTERDSEMLALHLRFPLYGFDRHKGYPTLQHLTALQAHGVCAIHRRSFAPVKALVEASV
jgi:ribonuclease HII